MTIYILLIFLIVLSMLFGAGNNSRESEYGEKWLKAIFLYIYLLCALRSSSVGRDVPGYEAVYTLTQSLSWSTWQYAFNELGYIFLMKICVLLGLSFQWFMAIVYAIIIYPVYLFIKRYSDNYGLSSLIFVCFQFLNFDLSGIRQALAMSLVLIGYIILIESKKFPLLKFVILIVIATLFHKGAYICYVFVIAYLIKSLRLFYFGTFIGLGTLLLIRGRLLEWVRDWFEKDTMDTGAGLYIGLTFIMTFLLSILFTWYLYYLFEDINKEDNRQNNEDLTDSLDNNKHNITFHYYTNVNFVKLYLIGFADLILFGSSTGVRSYMFMNQVLLILLPNTLNSKPLRSKGILEFIVSSVFVGFYISDLIVSGGFDIVPYKFFWQNN